MLKGQLEIGFVLRISLGFTILVATSYLMYTYMENAEKVKTQQFLERIVNFVADQVADTLPYIPENTTVYKRVFIPRTGDPFSGNYKVVVEVTNNETKVYAVSMRWSDVKAEKDLAISPSHALSQYSVAAPTLMCVSITRRKDVNKEYVISLGC